jgi:hypothetical protein
LLVEDHGIAEHEIATRTLKQPVPCAPSSSALSPPFMSGFFVVYTTVAQVNALLCQRRRFVDLLGRK